MNDTTHALNEDIAYMRDLAEAGASTPLLGGPILVLAGAIYGTATLLQWAVMQWGNPAGPLMIGFWFAVHAVFVVSMAWPIRALKRRAGAESPTNRAAGMAWSATGWSIFVLMAAAAVVAWRTQSGIALALAPSIVTTVYGAAWLISWHMSRQRWLIAPALGSFASSLVLAFLITTPHIYLVMGVIIYLIALVPGLVMMKREPAGAV